MTQYWYLFLVGGVVSIIIAGYIQVLNVNKLMENNTSNPFENVLLNPLQRFEKAKYNKKFFGYRILLMMSFFLCGTILILVGLVALCKNMLAN